MEVVIEQLIADFREHTLPSLTRRDVRPPFLPGKDERLLPMEASDLQLIPDVYFCCYPDLRDVSCTFFFDKIQNIPGWQPFLRRILDTERVHICLVADSLKFRALKMNTGSVSCRIISML